MIQVRNLKYSYSTNGSAPLAAEELEIGGGGTILLFGPTGSGKTTLLRCINGLVPHYYGGTMAGRVTVDGMDTRTNGPASISRSVGTVFQDPENQFLMLSVAEEIAFGLRNAALEERDVEAETASIAARFGIEHLLGRSIFELSSGQKQLVALASALTTRPAYLLLDEPTSQLDGLNAQRVMNIIAELTGRGGITAVVSEHRVARVAEHCSRFIGFEGGRLSLDGGFGDMRTWYSSRGVDLLEQGNGSGGGNGRTLLEVSRLGVSLGGRSVLEDAGMVLREGEVVSLVGQNGSGKTTLLKSIMNYLRKDRGSVRLDGRDITSMSSRLISRTVGYLSHSPLNYLFQPTLREELLFSARQEGMERARAEKSALETASDLGMQDKLELFPRDFSCGERELAAIGCTITGDRRVLLLDEPTRGMDYWRKSSFMELVRSICRKRKMSALIATHDLAVVRRWSDRAYEMRAGAPCEISPSSRMEA